MKTNMMKLILFVFINVFFLNIIFAQVDEYIIEGEIKDFPDNTWIYLSDLSDDSYKKIDSAKIVNNHVEFKGKLVSNVFLLQYIRMIMKIESNYGLIKILLK